MMASARAPLALLLLFASLPGCGRDELAARQLSGDGLDSVIFTLKAGVIRVNLPGDLAPGDPFSFTVFAQPAPGDEAARAENLKALSGHRVIVGGSPPTPPEAWGKWTIPPQFSRITVTLQEGGGEKIARHELTLGQAAPRPEGEENALDFLPPAVILAGRPLVIPGAFDGDFATTRLTVNGQPVILYAESPRRLVTAPAPPGRERETGSSTLNLNEGGREQSEKTRTIRVELDAPKLDLRSGETTVMTVTVSGLKDLKQPMKLKLGNHSATVVSLEGGNEQSKKIDEKSPNGEGIFTLTRTLTGIRPGEFDIQATVEPEKLDGILELELSRLLNFAAEPMRYRLSLDAAPLLLEKKPGSALLPVIGDNGVGSGSHQLALRLDAPDATLAPLCLRLTLAAPNDQPEYRLRAVSVTDRNKRPNQAPRERLPQFSSRLSDLHKLSKSFAWELRGAVYHPDCAKAPAYTAGMGGSGYSCLEHPRGFGSLDELLRHVEEHRTAVLPQ